MDRREGLTVDDGITDGVGDLKNLGLKDYAVVELIGDVRYKLVIFVRYLACRILQLGLNLKEFGKVKSLISR